MTHMVQRLDAHFGGPLEGMTNWLPLMNRILFCGALTRQRRLHNCCCQV
nr:hypothetical protein Iba_chr06cCG11840 [Ipomoea batatas]